MTFRLTGNEDPRRIGATLAKAVLDGMPDAASVTVRGVRDGKLAYMADVARALYAETQTATWQSEHAQTPDAWIDHILQNEWPGPARPTTASPNPAPYASRDIEGPGVHQPRTRQPVVRRPGTFRHDGRVAAGPGTIGADSAIIRPMRLSVQLYTLREPWPTTSREPWSGFVRSAWSTWSSRGGWASPPRSGARRSVISGSGRAARTSPSTRWRRTSTRRRTRRTRSASAT